MKIAVHGFAGRHRVFEDIVDEPDEGEIETDIEKMVMRHWQKISGYPNHMIEIEFLDGVGRGLFFRFGTDPNGMVMPIMLPVDGFAFVDESNEKYAGR